MQTETANNHSTSWPARSRAGRAALARRLDRRLALTVLLALLAGSLAYQARLAVDIAVGWLGDQLFLPSSQGLGQAETDAGRWYGDELTSGAASSRARWTRQAALVRLPGLGAGGDLELTIRAQGWPDDALNSRTSQPTITVSTPRAAIGTFVPSAGWSEHRLTIPAGAYSGDQLLLGLRASDVFTATQSFPGDIRPKGIRVERISLRGQERADLTIPAALPLLLLALNGGLCFLAITRLLRRPNAAFLLATLLISGAAIALAVARAWAVALLPWATAALLALIAAEQRHILGGALARLEQRFRRGWSLSYGLLAAALAWLGYLVVRAVLSALPAQWSPAQTAESVLASFPESILFVMLGLGLLVLALVLGPAGLPRLAQAAVTLLATRRWSSALLALFLAVWLGYEASVVATMPGVGHADYADNAVVARNLAAGRGWVVDYVTQFYWLYPGGVTRPQETWPLLQPVWIAPFFALFGPSDWAAKIPNLLFTLALGGLVYHVGSRLWDRRVGLVAVLFLLSNYLFFRLVVYVTSDLAFTLFAFGAIYLVYRWASADGVRATSWRLSLGSGALTGLMMLQKPASGVLIAFGIGLWLLARVWAERRPWRGNWRERLLPHALAWGVVALLVLSPYLARNLRLFGVPFFSTESLDAWVLEFGQWEEIYRIYTPEAGLSETGGLPDRSWLLRWGFDRTLLKLTNQVVAVRDYLVPPWNGLPLGLGAVLTGRKPLLFEAGMWLALLGLVAAARARGRLLWLLLAAFGPYTLFLIGYWHANEERYFVVLMPWLALLAAYGLWRVYDTIARIRAGRWAPLGLIATLALLVSVVQPSWPRIEETLRASAINVGDRAAYQWLRDNTPPDAVVMTRIPWQLNWHTERPALMIPNTQSPEHFMQLARYYQARYLMFEVAERPAPGVQRLMEQLVDDPALGFRKLHQRSSAFGDTVVYEFPSDYGGVPELQP